jgi:hypothetical protein
MGGKGRVVKAPVAPRLRVGALEAEGALQAVAVDSAAEKPEAAVEARAARAAMAAQAQAARAAWGTEQAEPLAATEGPPQGAPAVARAEELAVATVGPLGPAGHPAGHPEAVEAQPGTAAGPAIVVAEVAAAVEMGKVGLRGKSLAHDADARPSRQERQDKTR